MKSTKAQEERWAKQMDEFYSGGLYQFKLFPENEHWFKRLFKRNKQ